MKTYSNVLKKMWKAFGKPCGLVFTFTGNSIDTANNEPIKVLSYNNDGSITDESEAVGLLMPIRS